MFVPIGQLLSRRRALHRKERRPELRVIRDQLRDRHGSPTERGLAQDMRELRIELANAIGPLESCAGCARGMPSPQGRFAGGHCCSGATEDLFTDEETAALAMAGTRVRHLRTPACAPAGCGFRGPEGCTLDAVHRPNVCHRYFCAEARRELHARGQLELAESMIAELEADFAEFVAARAERRQREELRAIDPRLV